MSQLLGKADIYNTELCRAFIGFQIPAREVLKWLGREVGVKGGVSPMEEEVPEAEISSGDEAASSSGEAAAEAAPRKRPGSDDESKKKKKKLKTKTGKQQSLLGFFSVAKKG